MQHKLNLSGRGLSQLCTYIHVHVHVDVDVHVHVHSKPHVLSLQAEPGSSEPSPSSQLLSPSQPLPPTDLMKGMGMPPHITADQKVIINICVCVYMLLVSMYIIDYMAVHVNNIMLRL